MKARLIQALVLVTCTLTPSITAAQAPPEWTTEIRLGKPIFAVTATGERVEGVAGQVTGDGVLIATAVGVRTVAYTDIRKLEARDSVWTGVWIGAAIGAGLGLIVALDDSTCPQKTPGCRSEAAVAPLGGAIYGALIGWGIDAAVKGRRTIYESGGSGASVRLDVGRDGVAARFAIRW